MENEYWVVQRSRIVPLIGLSIDLNLGNFLFEYNHLRKHGGLNYETPFDKLQKVTELVR